MSTYVYKSQHLQRHPQGSKASSQAWSFSARRYLVATLVCAAFSAIYEYFSFGVYSIWMITLFVWPLLLGVLPCFLLANSGARAGVLSRQLLACAVATLVAGSCLIGVFEIYGTTSPLTAPYLLVGAAVLLLAALAVLIEQRPRV